MIHAVSMDEAWGDSGAPANMLPAAPVCSKQQARAPNEERGARKSGRSSRRTAHRTQDADDAELSVLAASIASLNSELAQLRELMEQQSHVQRTVMYACAVVAIVLLCVVAHAQAKLTHVGECLLWWGRRSE